MEFGTIESLWRYPVKSLIGESLTSVDIDQRGVSGDRLYALSDIDGKFGSGKNTKRFRRIDNLFSMSAVTTESGIAIKFPDSQILNSGDSSINSVISNLLGQSLVLTKEDKTPHFDDGAIHILTSASLSLLHELLPYSGIDIRRFRPNIVISSELFDSELLGKTINIGTSTLEITHKTERCRMITINQESLEARPEILKKISQNFDLSFGVYARVVCAGSVSVGDKVIQT